MWNTQKALGSSTKSTLLVATTLRLSSSRRGGSAPIAICPPIYGSQQKANARRIVVCQKICRGYSTDELEQRGLVALVGDELLKQEGLLKSIRERIRDWSSMTPADMKAALSDIEDEISAAELL
ncbi:TPA: hypothetical protein ACPD31_001754 [Escherichia coli]